MDRRVAEAKGTKCQTRLTHGGAMEDERKASFSFLLRDTPFQKMTRTQYHGFLPKPPSKKSVRHLCKKKTRGLHFMLVFFW